MANDVLRIRVYLERVRLDAGGYVRKGQAIQHGTYYGVGLPLYRAYAEWEGHQADVPFFEEVFRASNRDEAKDRVRGMTSLFPVGSRLVFSGRY